uniref:CTD small phosphatase-like protein 2 n=1 Tax=Anthurium amnicola TaxID=1678845 RepID=A0A1D1Y8T9_9ARAE
MQTRKKVVARNTVKEHAGPKFCRQQKKMTVVAEKKAAELITSSAKKQRPAGIISKKKIRDVASEKNMNTGALSREETQDHCVANAAPVDHKRFGDNDSRCVLDTIFSPSFLIPKDFCGGISNSVHFIDFSSDKDQTQCEEQIAEKSRNELLNGQLSSGKLVNISEEDKTGDLPSCHEEHKTLLNLSPEVSAIYLAMQHSKLECIDEATHDTMTADGCVDTDETDEFDDFDPYLFIKNLPDLSAVVPTFRPMLLPKQTRSCPSTTLVLDLDETLVHSSLDPCDGVDFTFPVNFNFREHIIYVRCRPHLKNFMERVSSLFEIIIFTASQSIYAEQLLNVLDPKRRLFRHRVYRESCIFVEGNYVKDLSVLGRDLARVIMVDNSPQAFGFQVDNGIPIESWFDDRSDKELLSLLPFLESLVGVEDVRPLIAKKFNLREKIAAAA